MSDNVYLSMIGDYITYVLVNVSSLKIVPVIGVILPCTHCVNDRRMLYIKDEPVKKNALNVTVIGECL